MEDPKQAARKRAGKLALDLGVLAGFILFVIGLYQVWHPLAPLVGGLLIAVACLFAGYDQLRRGDR
jgi:hypothetical protein